MNNKIGFGKFSTTIPANRVYRNFRVLETACAIGKVPLTVWEKPVDNWKNFHLEIEHSNPDYEKKIKKALDILLSDKSNSKSTVYKVSKLLQIPKHIIAEASEKINRTILRKKPVEYCLIPTEYHA